MTQQDRAFTFVLQYAWHAHARLRGCVALETQEIVLWPQAASLQEQPTRKEASLVALRIWQ